MGFVIWTLVGRDRWARRVGFGGPSGPALPPLANSLVQYSADVGITHRQARTLHVQRPWLLLTFLWIASVAALRVKAPFACSNDFRYVLPVIVPATLFWVGCGPFTKVLMSLMALLSVVFFVAL